jgi:hypothetical protein
MGGAAKIVVLWPVVVAVVRKSWVKGIEICVIVVLRRASVGRRGSADVLAQEALADMYV